MELIGIRRGCVFVVFERGWGGGNVLDSERRFATTGSSYISSRRCTDPSLTALPPFVVTALATVMDVVTFSVCCNPQKYEDSIASPIHDATSGSERK
jgi:hypothetical protein